MIGQTLPEYFFIRTCIAGLRLVAPASITYLLVCAATGRILVSPVLVAVAACEASFYAVFFFRYRGFNKVRQHRRHPPRLTRPQRRDLFERSASHITADHFLGCATNVHEWILWAMFASTPEHALPEWDEEIDEYILIVEESLGHKLEPGRAPGVQSLRLSFDPIHALHRPLIWYIIVGMVDTLTSALLLYLGFKHYAPPRSYLRAFPPRPLLSLLSKTAATPHFPYWYRPPRAGGESKNPILFLHGIGIGLYPYVPLFREILRADPTQSLVLIEFLPVSFRMTVAALVLIDPIPFLLHLPTVAHNFLYRAPGRRRANEWQLWYFASRDADVARVLGRCFFWEEGCIWREDLRRFGAEDGRRVAVVLGGGDQIIPSADVREYLTADEAGEWARAGGGSERWASRAERLEVLWFPGLDHATVFETKERRKMLMWALDPPRTSYGAVDG
ncbi:hypothetical protein B0H14DRAFT_3105204 [Mycena olivaceomarginata]|nr:hypothetical protein B0H14DRAFT_3105204 [Mycena olivaceomarginata]